MEQTQKAVTVESKTITFSVKTFVGLMATLFIFFGSILTGVIKVYGIVSTIDTRQQINQTANEGKQNVTELRLKTVETGLSTLDTKVDTYINSKK